MSQTPHRIIIGHLNISSVTNKLESLVRFVGNNLDILVVSETKIDDTFPESQFLIEGFSKADLTVQPRVGEFCSI